MGWSTVPSPAPSTCVRRRLCRRGGPRTPSGVGGDAVGVRLELSVRRRSRDRRGSGQWLFRPTPSCREQRDHPPGSAALCQPSSLTRILAGPGYAISAADPLSVPEAPNSCDGSKKEAGAGRARPGHRRGRRYGPLEDAHLGRSTGGRRGLAGERARPHRHTVADYLRAALANRFRVRRFEEEPGPGPPGPAPEPTHEVGTWPDWPWTLLGLVPRGDPRRPGTIPPSSSGICNSADGAGTQLRVVVWAGLPWRSSDSRLQVNHRLLR